MRISEFINQTREKIKDPIEIISKLEKKEFVNMSEEDYNDNMSKFLQYYWELFISSQNLAETGDISGLIVYMMLNLYSTTINMSTNKNREKEAIVDLMNKLTGIYDEVRNKDGK